MTRTVLVIHGAGEPRRRGGKIYWEPLVQQSLGSGYVVHAPRMPAPEDPHHAPWANRIAELIAASTRPVVVEARLRVAPGQSPAVPLPEPR